ncbi:hypothetical protein WKH49_02380 [Pantoea agglomerans]|uniref:hypothetical protein n=1 Tax=Enterobacter agglomerans TaxID=549 RepID=UPI003C7C97D6
MSETTNEILSFLDSESPADSPAEQSHDVEKEELDTDESTTEESTHDDEDEYEAEEESTADSDDEEHESDDDSTISTEANNIDDHDFTLTIDGEEVTVKGSELKSGYMRQAAFTKKTQEIATQRKALEAELTKAVERSEAVKFNANIEMERLDGALKQLGGWDGLRREATPEQYDQFHSRYIQAKKDAELADDILRETSNSMRETNAKTIENIFKEMASTRDGFNAGTINELDKFLSNRGFTEDQVLSMTSPEAWDIVYDAMQYQKLQERTNKNVKTEKKKEIESKSHLSAPVKKTNQKESKSRQIEKGLKEQRKAKGKSQSAITQDLLMKIL